MKATTNPNSWRANEAQRSMPPYMRKATITGRIRQPADPALPVFYTDGSAATEPTVRGLILMTGWGYISTDGRYGCGRYPQVTATTSQDPAQIAELRAVWHALGEHLANNPTTVFLDSQNAVTTLTNWQSGGVTMPAGYPRSIGRRTTTLEQLRRAVAANPAHLTLRHVRAHCGDILNEAADALARLGTRWSRDKLPREDVETRAAGIAESFLADYRRRAPR